MLTNTIILFLRDLLPMFIMFAYVNTLYKAQLNKVYVLFIPVVAALLFSITVLLNYESISDTFNGFGIESLKITLIILTFMGFVFSEIKIFAQYRSTFLLTAIFSLLSVYFNSFLLYFTIYFSYEEFVFELLIGCVIGIGICISFYYLFHFFMTELWQSKFKCIVIILWSLFLSNQFSAVANYLHQINIVDFGTKNLINLAHLVQEESEYGFFLKALVGFDTTPSVFYFAMISISFVVMFTLMTLCRKACKRKDNEYCN